MSVIAPFGTEAWGIAPWGAGLADLPSASVSSIAMIRTNVARVTFAAPVQSLDPAGFMDALNPANWTVTRKDGGFSPQVVRVALVGTAPATQVDLWMTTSFDAGVLYDIAASPSIKNAS